MAIDERILIPGGAGELEPDELQFVKQELKRRPGLRVKWGFTKEAKKFPDKKVQQGANATI